MLLFDAALHTDHEHGRPGGVDGATDEKSEGKSVSHAFHANIDNHRKNDNETNHGIEKNESIRLHDNNIDDGINDEYMNLLSSSSTTTTNDKNKRNNNDDDETRPLLSSDVSSNEPEVSSLL